VEAAFDWLNNHPSIAWLIFVALWGALIAVVAWPRKLTDLNNPDDYGC
jgi:CHASE2 domain-containing sensor protein